jgi:transcriptional regulator with XRE-family HTH domain
LNEAREASGLTQEAIAQRLNTYQRLVSRCLTGERRMDIIEARAFCQALGIPFGEFAVELDRLLAEPGQDARKEESGSVSREWRR